MLFYCRPLLFCALENVFDGRVTFVVCIFSMVYFLCGNGNGKAQHVVNVMGSV